MQLASYDYEVTFYFSPRKTFHGYKMDNRKQCLEVRSVSLSEYFSWIFADPFLATNVFNYLSES